MQLLRCSVWLLGGYLLTQDMRGHLKETLLQRSLIQSKSKRFFPHPIHGLPGEKRKLDHLVLSWASHTIWGIIQTSNQKKTQYIQ